MPDPALLPRRGLADIERVAAVARLRRAVARAVDHDRVLERGETIVVAVSGGPDSSVLLDTLARLAATRDWRLLCVHVDHGLRPDSAAEAETVRAFALSRGVPFAALTASLPPRGSRQDRARRGRYAALGAVARETGATAIATGHTADDQAETVLWRVLTGASPALVAGMPGRRGRLARPLLGVWRDDVEACAAALGLTPLRDPSNADRAFLRSRIRHDLLPYIETVFPAARRGLVALAAGQRRLLDDGGGGAS